MEATRAALLLVLKPVCVLPSFSTFFYFLAGLESAASTLWIQSRTQLRWKPQLPPQRHVHHHNVGHYKPKPEEEERCPVCLCGMEEGEEVRELRCTHLFHKGCLDRWVEFQKTTCPLCRESLVEQDQEEDDDDDEVGEDSALYFMAYFHRSTWWVWRR